MENKRIVVITHGYPNKVTPTSRTFVRELVEKWREFGIDVTVIRPVTLINYIKIKRMHGNARYHINDLFPLYCDYTPLRAFRFTRRIQALLSDRSFEKAVLKTGQINKNCIVYCHFLNAAYCGVAIAEKFRLDCYCAVGESSFWTIKDKNIESVKNRLKKIKAFIAVSTEKKNDLVKLGFADKDNIYVLPNGVDQKTFYKLDKVMCREKLGVNKDLVIGIYLDAFSERKGVNRVDQAIANLSNTKMIYIGSGEIKPQKNVLFIKRVDHSEVNVYLSAADYFVLPTLAEGCSNAIVEAMVCGLPIISSDRDFNKDILDTSCALLIDPESIDEIRSSIKQLVEDENLRNILGNNALIKSKMFDLSFRARRIIKIMGMGQIDDE